MWKVHCHRDFKEERPEEYESWREMYLRLQDAREQRLRVLTKNIRSAHANKPKGGWGCRWDGAWQNGEPSALADSRAVVGLADVGPLAPKSLEFA